MSLKQIIKRNVDEFIVKITDRTDINGGLRTYKSDFPIFHPANEYYFEYRRSEDLLERYIREYLVTGILCSLLSDKNVRPCLKNREVLCYFNKMEIAPI